LSAMDQRNSDALNGRSFIRPMVYGEYSSVGEPVGGTMTDEQRKAYQDGLPTREETRQWAVLVTTFEPGVRSRLAVPLEGGIPLFGIDYDKPETTSQPTELSEPLLRHIREQYGQGYVQLAPNLKSYLDLEVYGPDDLEAVKALDRENSAALNGGTFYRPLVFGELDLANPSQKSFVNLSNERTLTIAETEAHRDRLPKTREDVGDWAVVVTTIAPGVRSRMAVSLESFFRDSVPAPVLTPEPRQSCETLH